MPSNSFDPIPLRSTTEGQVPEGHLPPGTRPSPGRRPSREAWLGKRKQAVEARDDAAVEETSQSTSMPSGPDHPVIRHFRHRVERFTNDGHATGRLTGIDAARGLAMVGMVAIHTLPELNEKTGRPTMNWNLFSGHASALFAVLAGVTISLLSGGNNPHTGDRMQQTRIMLGTRALVLLLFGLTLNFMDFSAHNILLYYGLYFLLVIPFTTMTSGQLFVMGGFCAIFGPLAIQATRLVTVIDPSPNPSLEQAVSDPIGTILALFALGTYPAFTWLTFIFIGMGIGRLQLTREKTQTKLVFYGLTIALTSSIASQMLLYQFGGLEAIQRANASMSGDNIQSIIDFGGGNDQLETTMWWLVIPTPHSNTTFSVLISGGIAIALIGVFLMLGKQKVVPLALLADIGSMTLTLFTLHLTFLSIVDVDAKPVLWFITQIGVAISIAAIWKRIWKRGPLEYIVTTVCGNTARILQPKVASLLRRGGASGDEAQREGLDGAESESDVDLEDSEELIPSIESVFLPALHDVNTTMQYKQGKNINRASHVRLFGQPVHTTHHKKK